MMISTIECFKIVLVLSETVLVLVLDRDRSSSTSTTCGSVRVRKCSQFASFVCGSGGDQREVSRFSQIFYRRRFLR